MVTAARSRRDVERPQETDGTGTASTHRTAVEQVAVLAGQAGAGLGNLAFALVAIRLLAPGAYADLAAFLAVYVLLHEPTKSLTAGTALTPGLAAHLRRRTLLAGCAVGVGLAVAAVPLAEVADLAVAQVLLLALAAPGAGLLSLARGRLYGDSRVLGVSASLLAEPTVRLGLGIVAAHALGATGAAVVVVLAGYASLAVAHLAARRSPSSDDRPSSATGGGVSPRDVVVGFLLLALLQHVDVLLANSVLPDGEAGLFAVVSTLGMAAAFATATVPFVLLPRAAGGNRSATPVALALTAAIGGVLTLAVALAPTGLLTAAFGDRYAELGSIAGLYTGAMALLGVARVLVAAQAAAGSARPAVAVLALGVVAQVTSVLVLARTAADVAVVTLLATTAVVVLLGVVEVVRLRARPAPARTDGSLPR